MDQNEGKLADLQLRRFVNEQEGNLDMQRHGGGMKSVQKLFTRRKSYLMHRKRQKQRELAKIK